MGSTSSIINRKYIYISYSLSCKENKFINILVNELSEFEKYNITEMPTDIYTNIDEYRKNIEFIINKSCYVIICLSPKTISSVFQIMEINKIWDTNKQIIYIMTDSSYTPLTNSNLNGVIKHHHWFPCYDEETLTSTLSGVIELLSS